MQWVLHGYTCLMCDACHGLQDAQAAEGRRRGDIADIDVPKVRALLDYASLVVCITGHVIMLVSDVTQTYILLCPVRMQELDKLAWFGSTKGVASLVADAMKEDGAHTLSDVAVALQAAHLLVWQHEVEHGEACFLTCIWWCQ